MTYCAYDGRRASWPRERPQFCSMRCAAEQGLILRWVTVELPYCADCGRENRGDGFCYNPECPGA